MNKMKLIDDLKKAKDQLELDRELDLKILNTYYKERLFDKAENKVKQFSEFEDEAFELIEKARIKRRERKGRFHQVYEKALKKFGDEQAEKLYAGFIEILDQSRQNFNREDAEEFAEVYMKAYIKLGK